jgi:hypothetical protein
MEQNKRERKVVCLYFDPIDHEEIVRHHISLIYIGPMAQNYHIAGWMDIGPIVYVPAGTLPKTTHGRNGFFLFEQYWWLHTIAIVASPLVFRRYIVVGHRRRRHMAIVSNTHTIITNFWSAPNIFAG